MILSISKTTRLLFLFSFVLLLYYFIARNLNLFFFWESITIGVLLSLLTFVFLLNDIKKKFSNKRLKIISNVLIGIISFYLIVQVSFLIIIPNSKAYDATKNQIYEDESIIKETGVIKGFAVLPTGAIQVNQTANQKSGSGVLKLIIKGEKLYKTANVHIIKEGGENWKIQQVDISK